jgi:hypothetical protein
MFPDPSEAPGLFYQNPHEKSKIWNIDKHFKVKKSKIDLVEEYKMKI